MVAGKRVIAAAATAAVAVNATFDNTKPFVLQTEVINGGNSSFNGFYLSPFHVGAGEQTIIGGRNASLAIEFGKAATRPCHPLLHPFSTHSNNPTTPPAKKETKKKRKKKRSALLTSNSAINGTSLIQPIENGTYFFQAALLPQPPTLSNAPPYYDYISLNFWGGESTSSGFSTDEDEGVPALRYSGADFDGWALCRVNGTAPYFGVGAEWQLFWKSKGAVCGYQRCADVELVASNVGEFL